MQWDSAFSNGKLDINILTPIGVAMRGIDDSLYTRMERHIESITTWNSGVLRILNIPIGEFITVKYLHGNDSLTEDEWLKLVGVPSIPLYNYCWIIRNDEDSLRYVYYDDIRKQDSARLIDTTVYSHDAIMEQMDFLCTLDLNAVRRGYPLIRYRTPYHIYFEVAAAGRPAALSTEVSYWKDGKFVYVHLRKFWNYSFCGEGVEVGGKDGEIVRSLMQHLCFVKAHGGFQDGFIATFP